MTILVPIFIPTMGSGVAPSILFSPGSITINSSAGTVVGTAILGGKSTGAPAWVLTANSSGTYAISSATGVVTILSTTKLAAETESITISATGAKPTVQSRTFQIVVTSLNASSAGLNFSINANSQYIPLLVP